MSIILRLNELGVEPRLMTDSSGTICLETKPKKLTGKAKLLIEMNEHVIVETLKEERDQWIKEWRRSRPPEGNPWKGVAQSIYHLWLKDFLLKKYAIALPKLSPNTPQSEEVDLPWQ